MDFLCFFFSPSAIYTLKFNENIKFFFSSSSSFPAGKLISHFNTSNELKLVILIQKLLSGIIFKKSYELSSYIPLLFIGYWILYETFSQKLLSIVLWISNGFCIYNNSFSCEHEVIREKQNFSFFFFISFFKS